MEGLNKCDFIGNLGANAEVRHTQAGRAVMSFRMGCGHRYRGSDGEWKEETDWVNVVLFGARAEGLGPRLKKGSKVYVSGRLRTRSYEDREGETRYMTEIVARQLLPLTIKGQQVREDSTPDEVHDDDLPSD